MKKALSLLLAAAMMFTLLAGCGPKTPGSSSGSESAEPVTEYLPNLMVMSGPTGVGAAKLMADAENFNPEDPSTFRSFVVNSATVVADNEAVKNALVSGEADIAAVATNVAASLVNKMEGGIQVLAINTLGVLYILEKGDTVHEMSDLKGKTLYAPSNTKGANPEHILNHLLMENSVEPEEVNIEWLTPQEITVKMTTEDAGICMLPVPAATAVLVKDAGVREAISLSEAWEDIEGSPLPMGCVVARTKFVEENPDAVASFLAEYEQSIAFIADEANRAEASEMVASFGIAPNAAIAAKAIPQCNLTFVTGEEMKDTLESYYRILFQNNPGSIGGSMPYDDFYYGVE